MPLRQSKVFALLAVLCVSCGSSENGGSAGAAPGPDAGALESGGGAGGGAGGDAATAPDVAADAVCTLSTCTSLGAECGSAPDGCGATIECGTCAPGKTCGGAGPNKCGNDPCAPKTCAQQGASCGQVSDGCTSVIDCGWCTAPDSCGGAGVANQCGCVCNPAHGKGECSGSGCKLLSCEAGWADCNALADDGCETQVSSDPLNCGSCGNACSLPHTTSACVDGECQVGACETGWGDCDGKPFDGCEVNLLTSKQHCGECDLECLGFCDDGFCECAKPCGQECCSSGQKCCVEAEMCWASTEQCPLPR